MIAVHKFLGVVLGGALFFAGVVQAQDSAFTVLHDFTGGITGGDPTGAIARDPAGAIFGTTQTKVTGRSVLYRLDRNGRFRVLHAFTGTVDGTSPNGVVMDAAGNLYGTAEFGGDRTCDCGVVFKVDTKGNYSILHSFTETGDGGYPTAGVVFDTAGNIYGTIGFQHGYGNVYKIDTTGHFSVLYNFTDHADGYGPNSLIIDTAGNLYGTASGGTSNAGVVFKLDTSANFSVVYTFSGASDGSKPQSLALDPAGNLYGSTEDGGNTACASRAFTGCGVIFKLDTAGNFSLLYSFAGGRGGSHPLGALVRDRGGNLYGSTLAVGKGRPFFLFKVSPAGGFYHLHRFTSGYNEVSGLMTAGRNLYGTTAAGGQHNQGTIFKAAH